MNEIESTKTIEDQAMNAAREIWEKMPSSVKSLSGDSIDMIGIAKIIRSRFGAATHCVHGKHFKQMCHECLRSDWKVIESDK